MVVLEPLHCEALQEEAVLVLPLSLFLSTLCSIFLQNQDLLYMEQRVSCCLLSQFGKAHASQ